MPVKKEPNGRRSVQAEVEVPGTPEEVWNAIATGPGISSWFVPSLVEEKAGGKIAMSFGPGMDSHATIDEWQPPQRFVASNPDEAGPNNPAVATEWTVEAQSGGSCVVRVVHSWFASTDDWDDQFEGHTHGWNAFFRTLRLYLTQFRGQHAQCLQLMATSAKPTPEAFGTLTAALGIGTPQLAQRVTSRNAPALSGVVENVGPADYPQLLVRMDEPTAGIGHLFAFSMGPQTMVVVRFYLFGKQESERLAKQERTWQEFLQATFPS